MIIRILILLFVVNINYSANAQFGLVNYIDTINPGAVIQIESGDFNNDGFVDLLIANNEWPHDKLKIYFNNAGSGFSGANFIALQDTFQHINSIAVADIDNDNWPDIFVAEGFPMQIRLLKNNQGIFNSQVFDQNLDNPTDIIIHDFDQNGFMDVLSLQHLEVALYMQDISGFAARTVIHDGTEFYEIHINDFNGDGFTDVAVATVRVDFLHNDGLGNFQFHSSVGQGITFTLASADVDNDGDIDLFTWEALQGILLYENNGTGTFNFSDSIIQHAENFQSILVHDFDSDNDPDIISSFGQTGEIILLHNDGSGNYSPWIVIHHEPGELVYEVNTADFNNDGKMDVVWGDKKIGYRLNTFPLNINNITKSKDIIVYPNPAKDLFFIKNNSEEQINIKLIDITGKIMFEKNKVTPHETTSIKINEKGIYLINVMLNNETIIHQQKIVSY